MPRPGWVPPAATLALLTVALVATYAIGLGRYGLWEPWEADRLEEATDDDLEGELPEIPSGGAWARGSLVQAVNAAGFRDGAAEGRVRLPAALVAIGTLVIAFFIGSLLFGLRVAAYSTIVMATLPLFLATGRLVVWSALPMAAHVLIFGGGAIACLGPFRPRVNVSAGVAFALVGAVVGWLSVGPLLGCAVPILAAGLGALFARSWEVGPTAKWTAIGLVLAGVVALGWAAVPFFDDAYLETAAATAPAGFEMYFRQLIIGCYPWTGLLAVGLAVLARPNIGDREDRAIAILTTGFALTFLAQTLWSRYAGEAPFIAIWPLAVAGGLVLARSEDSGGSRRVAALICLMLVALGLRDHLLEPVVALVPLADSDASLPEGVKGRLFYLLGALLVGAPVVLALAHGGGRPEPGSYREWAGRWLGWIDPRGKGVARWIAPAISVLLLVNGVLTAVAPSALWISHMSCLERRLAILVGALVPVCIVAALGAKVLWDLTGRMGPWRPRCAAAGGVVLALIGVHGAVPELSNHLSSRGIGLAFEAAADPSSRLIGYRASTRAVELLGATEIEEARSLDDLADQLVKGAKTYGIIRAEDLARADIRYRRKTGKHIPVVDDRSANLLLLAGKLGAGQKSRNPLETIVPLERPTPERQVIVNFDDKVELIGIDFETSGGGDSVCPIDSFTVRYYWHVLQSIPGSYKLFVHIDGFGLRINGDHEPAEGRYPIRDWQQGDFVVDEHQLKVPAHFRPGDYTIYIGFFQGSKRLPVREGPASSDNRGKAGILRVR